MVCISNRMHQHYVAGAAQLLHVWEGLTWLVTRHMLSVGQALASGLERTHQTPMGAQQLQNTDTASLGSEKFRARLCPQWSLTEHVTVSHACCVTGGMSSPCKGWLEPDTVLCPVRMTPCKAGSKAIKILSERMSERDLAQGVCGRPQPGQ